MQMTDLTIRDMKMRDNAYETEVREIMDHFASKTGLSTSDRRPTRYLWTDAFAVCIFLWLHRQTGEVRYRTLALDLVSQVHETLGKHREDDPRHGWISGLEENQGALHPTIAGLRIGKRLGERNRNEPFDEHLEWEREGQYYHYLTKWMHALHQASAMTGDPVFHRWACELAKSTHRTFVHNQHPGTPKRLYWKMSIDLTYPLVPFMGHHDPLDGFVTYHELHRREVGQINDPSQCDLTGEIADLAQMCRDMQWTTDDPLGIGGLLFDACRMLQMMSGETGFDDHGLLPEVLCSSIVGLKSWLAHGSVKAQPEDRLAFRELGLAIGLRAIPKMLALQHDATGPYAGEILEEQLNNLMAVVPVAEVIEAFWLRSVNQQSASWQAHENINMVMLATSLASGGFLTLQPAPQPHTTDTSAGTKGRKLT